MIGTTTEPVVECRNVRCTHSDNLPDLLAKLRLSVLISTYQTGHVIVASGQRGRLALTLHQFDRAMGMALKPGAIAVCTRKEVWFLRDAPDIAAKIETGKHDACFLARTCHYTGDIHAHESAWVGREVWVVNTRFSRLAALHPTYSFAPRWKPPFISALAAEDRCHLNGLAVVDGQPRYVTLLAETDTPAGWRKVKAAGGCILEVPSGRAIARGLSLPHSPRVVGERLFFLQSGHGRLDRLDLATGQVEEIGDVPGVPRGLALHQRYAFVGLSKARPSLDGVPIVERRESLKCGVAVLDVVTGKLAAMLEFCTGVEEIFDVQVLPGITSPYLSGPCAEQDNGTPLWTVPPG